MAVSSRSQCPSLGNEFEKGPRSGPFFCRILVKAMSNLLLASGRIGRELCDPASLAQQRGNPPITIATKLDGQRDDVGCQSRFIFWPPGDRALSGAMLA